MGRLGPHSCFMSDTIGEKAASKDDLWRERSLNGFKREGEIKRRAFAGRRFRPDAPTQAFDDALACGKADAAARYVWTVQTFERLEYLFRILMREALAVCRLPNLPVIASAHRLYVNARAVLCAVFKAVTDEALQYQR
jgi:hypothetical protein